MNFKKAVVTGGSKGIGAAAAIALAREGADVLLVARDENGLKSVQSQIIKIGRRCEYIKMDIGNPAEVERFENSLHDFGGVDLYINNAAFTIRKSIIKTSYEEMFSLYQTNFFGAILMTQAAARCMKAQNRGGAITFVTSINALSPLPNQGIYSCTKASLEAAVKSLAAELAPYNIRVNSVAPGAVLTDMNPGLIGERADNLAKTIPLGHIGTPEEIADVIVFLCSAQAQYITGSTIVAGGGFLLRKIGG